MVLALAVAAFFFIRLRPYLPERARAAELAPAETVLFVQIPNLRETAFRVPGTDLYAIWREPEVQAFLEKPRSKAAWMKQWEERYEEVVRVAPGEMFIAFTALGERPAFVGGFSFAGSRHAAEALMEKSHDLLPAGVVTHVRSNWLLFASDAALLEGLRARFDGPVAGPALGGDPAFQQAIAAIGVGQDLVAYGSEDSLLRGFPALAGKPKKPGESGRVAMGTKIQRGRLHDTIFIPGPPGSALALSRQTLACAGPQTLLYYASDWDLLTAGSELGMVRALLPQMAAVEKGLAERGLTWSSLPAAFGPELGVICEWPEDAALPMVVAAPQVRDAAQARNFIDAATASGTSPWTREEANGVLTATAPASAIPLIHPVIALQDRFALAGTAPEIVASTLARLSAPGPSLADSPAFQEATRLVAPAASALGYVDFEHLFARIYRLARPVITLSIAFSPDVGAHFDAGKLPLAETISKHLAPLVVFQTRQEHGLLIESTGTVTFAELGLALAAAGGGSGMSGLSGLIPGGVSLPSLGGGSRSGVQKPAAPRSQH